MKKLFIMVFTINLLSSCNKINEKAESNNDLFLSKQTVIEDLQSSPNRLSSTITRTTCQSDTNAGVIVNTECLTERPFCVTDFPNISADCSSATSSQSILERTKIPTRPSNDEYQILQLALKDLSQISMKKGTTIVNEFFDSRTGERNLYSESLPSIGSGSFYRAGNSNMIVTRQALYNYATYKKSEYRKVVLQQIFDQFNKKVTIQ